MNKKKKKLKITIFYTLEQWKYTVSLELFALVSSNAKGSTVSEN